MVKKRVFPDDWSNFTSEQVLENVKYLMCNYKKYKISKTNNSTFIIGNVKVERKPMFDIDGHIHLVCIINNRRCDCETKDFSGLWAMTMFLNFECEKQAKTLKEKAKIWWNKNNVNVAAVCISIVMVGVVAKIAFALVKWGSEKLDEADRIKAKTESVEKQLLNYDKIKKTDTLMITKDTLKNNIK